MDSRSSVQVKVSRSGIQIREVRSRSRSRPVGRWNPDTGEIERPGGFVVDPWTGLDVHWIDLTKTNIIFGILIVLSAINIGLQIAWCSCERWYAMDLFFSLFLATEVFIRLKVHKMGFFCDHWNLFDFVIFNVLVNLNFSFFLVDATLILAPLSLEEIGLAGGSPLIAELTASLLVWHVA